MHGRCTLPAAQSHYVLRVLRLVAGNQLTLFDGRGNEYAAEITHANRDTVTLQVAAPVAVDRESPLRVTLAQGLSGGERMDYTVQKSVELGVREIQPLATVRSVVRLSEDRALKRVSHWQAVAAAACEQCGRNVLPTVHSLQPFYRWLELSSSAESRLMLSPRASTRLTSLPQTRGTVDSVVLLAGPEGGLAPEEESAAQAAGFIPVCLGPRVLRTETAAVAALSAMQAMWGDF